MRLSIDECGWREVGARLADAMQGIDEDTNDSRMRREVYYSILCHVEKRIQADKRRIKPDDDPPDTPPVLSDPDVGPPPSQAKELVIPEKVADMTHRGPGL